MDLRVMEDRSLRAIQAREKQYLAQINKAFRDALEEVRLKMAKLYEKYAKDGVLSLADMTRYNRLQTLEKSLVLLVDDASRKVLRTIERLRPDMYEEAFFRMAWAIDQTTQVSTAWGVLNRDVVLENIASEFYRISKERYGPEARALIKQALNEGLPAGKSYTRMMRDLKKALNTSNFNALRIARTEGQTAVNAGQDAALTRAEDKGVQGRRIWDATLDARTRPDHATADGQEKHAPTDAFASGYFVIGGEKTPYPAWQGLSAKQRINCRCRERFEVEGYAPQLRRTREQGVIPYQTYTDWKKSLNARGATTAPVGG